MDVDSFVKQLTAEQKALLTHGKGAWKTNSVNGLPTVTVSDGPHGLRKQADGADLNDSVPATCFPTASAVASSWNRSNASAVAAAIADEAISEDISVVLGPGVNIKRSPLCGRNFEYFSEDPLLAGEMAASYVSAMQSKGVGCCVKHFAVNSQETNRMTLNAVLDERALREIYLAPFERVVKKSQPYAVMAAYNKVNGDSCTQNAKLLTDILRKEWGFCGAVMSDWGACYDMGKAFSAGLDLEMPDGGRYHERKTLKALQEGELLQDDLDRACRNVAALADRCSPPKQKNAVDHNAHHRLCRKIAADCAVLLKNNGILPLSKNRHVLVVGELAEKPRFQGSGSSHVNAQCVSFLDVLRQNNIDFTYVRGYRLDGDFVDEQLEFEASKAALKCDTVLFFGGLTDVQECEGYDRQHLNIPNCQLSLLNAVTQHNPNVAFVACGGAPFATPWINQVKALLHMHLGGEAVTEAAFDLLFGAVSPSGRLAETYPLRIEDTPCYNYFAGQGNVAEYRESIFVGYRYYNTFDVPVAFPFGYGLSYSLFTYSDLRVQQTEQGYRVTVNVKNIGKMAASEVVQVYVDSYDCGYMRSKRRLAGFEKVFIQSGESLDVSVDVDMSSFRIYTDGAFRTVKGKYKIAVCKDVEHVILNQYIEVDGETLKGADRRKYPAYYERRTQVKNAAEGAMLASWEVDSQQFYALAGYDPSQNAVPDRYTLLSTFDDLQKSSGVVRLIVKYLKKYAVKHSPTRSADDPVAKMIYASALTTPLISMMGMANIKPKYVMFLLYSARKQRKKALAALMRGKYDIE